MLAEYASGFERTLNIAHRIVSTINHLLYYDADNQCYVNGYRPTIRYDHTIASLVYLTTLKLE